MSIAGRCSPVSTEVIYSISGKPLLSGFSLELWGSANGKHAKIGYAKFELCSMLGSGEHQNSAYRLAQLLPPDFPPPGQIASMSGVFWEREGFALQPEMGGFSIREASICGWLSQLLDRAESPRES